LIGLIDSDSYEIISENQSNQGSIRIFMCLSVPAEVLAIEGNRAKVSVGGVIYTAGLHLVEEIQVSDYILLHAGYALQKIDPVEARETLALLKEIQAYASEIPAAQRTLAEKPQDS
jgi:hydrogenase expression/formation protein HypC